MLPSRRVGRIPLIRPPWSPPVICTRPSRSRTETASRCFILTCPSLAAHDGGPRVDARPLDATSLEPVNRLRPVGINTDMSDTVSFEAPMESALNIAAGSRIKTGVGQEAGVAELEDLYRSRYGHFLRVAQLITGDRDRAHDAVQEGFANVLRSRKTYRRSGPLEAWVWRTVVNAARKQAARRPAALADDDQPVAVLDDGDRSDQRVVRAWVATLPERQRLAIFLRYYADLDYRAIAECSRSR
jgi:RNA polymerase sigma factor (sigma-70 family)